ncbi:MAG: hypothetical protein N3F65_04410 [Nitrososphaeria archaeon]|nr:hypothetical protein [Nitrososphaeria archaeon]
MDEPSTGELAKILVECLRREGGEATPDRLLYAYRSLQGLTRERLLEVAEGCGEIEVVHKKYRGLDERDAVTILRLRELGGGAPPANIGEKTIL